MLGSLTPRMTRIKSQERVAIMRLANWWRGLRIASQSGLAWYAIRCRRRSRHRGRFAPCPERLEDRTCLSAEPGFTFVTVDTPPLRPTIGSLTADPNPAIRYFFTTVTANAVTGPVDYVEFYRDINNNGVGDVEPDGSSLERIGRDSDGSDGWSWVGFPTEEWPTGPVTILARATEDGADFRRGDWVSTVLTVQDLQAPDILTMESETENNNTVTTANAVAINSRVSGSIAVVGDQDYFAVTLTEASLLTTRVETDSGMDVVLSLFDEEGELLLTSDSDRLELQSASIEQHLAPGTYVLSVQVQRSGLGSYELVVQREQAGLRLAPVPVGRFPESVLSGDFNGDGRLDLATANIESGDVSVLLGLGDGTFPTELRFAVGYLPESLLSGDFNGDGRLDLATANNLSNDVSVLLGLGDGTFASEQRFSAGAYPRALLSGDFNGDGRLDLATANRGDVAADISVLLGLGDGTFATEQRFSVGSVPLALLSGDFNGDGRLDLATANILSNDVSVLLGLGDGTFASEQRISVGAYPKALLSGDFNGDGRLDLATANRYSNDVSVLLGLGDGTFPTELRFAVGYLPESLLSGDFNGDGRLDLATANSGTNDVSMLVGLGDGTFAAERRFAVGDSPESQLSGDFNGDGWLDLATANNLSNDVSVLLGLGDGTFASEQLFSAGAYPRALLSGDFNGDGRLDVATANISSNDVSVLLGLGDGTFTAEQKFSVGTDPRALLSGDFNKDGRLDVATANISSNDVSVLLGLGDGTFTAEQKFSVGTLPTTLLSGDFNGDGRLDLATANNLSNDVSVLLGFGDGTFTAERRIAVGASPESLLSGDFNGDGRLDLATANSESNDVSVLLVLANGEFDVERRFAVHGSPNSLLSGDFNEDGRLDLATTSESNDVSMLLGLGDGTFAVERRFAVGDSPESLQSGDFNEDGLLDLATANSGSNDISVLVGLGDGTFAVERRFKIFSSPNSLLSGDFWVDLGRREEFVDLAALSIESHEISVLLGLGFTDGTFVFVQRISVGALPTALLSGDFNGDGRLDLATASDYFSEVSVLLGLGNGTFSVERRFAVGDLPESLLSGDFNGDGRLDLVTANSGSNDVSVLLGLTEGAVQEMPTVEFISSADSASNLLENSPQFVDVDGDLRPDLVVINRAGQILFRRGQADSPQAFDAPLIINPADRPARAITAVSGRLAAVNFDDSVSVYSVATNGNVMETVRLVTGVYPTRIASADLDSDGRQDLVVSNVGSRDVSLFLAQPSGDFQTLPQISVGVAPSALELTDVDHSGSVDILVANAVSGDVSLLLNRDHAAFDEYRYRVGTGFYTLDSDARGPYVRSLAGTDAIATGDFNEDGRTDAIVANPGEHGFSVVFGSPHGGFVNPNRQDSVLTGTRPALLRIGDFNRDGHQDLALINEEIHEIWIFVGDGHGEFTKVSVVDTGSVPTGLTVTDVTGPEDQPDGLLDLLVGNEFGDVLTLAGKGDGTFGSPIRADRNVPLAIADLDGDGEVDYVLANQSRDRVLVRLSKSGEQQPPETADRPLLAPGAVKLADLNHDNVPDLVVANSGSNNVLVYRGLGGGEFAPPDTYFAGTNPVGITIADVTGDAQPDLIIANQGSNDVSILKWQPDATGEWVAFGLGPRLDLGAGAGPVSTNVLDQNQDGVPDLLVTNAQAGTVSLLPGRGGGFFNDQTPTTINIGPTSSQGGTVIGNAFFAVDPRANSVTYISNLTDFLNSNNPESFIRSFNSGGLGPTSLLPFDLNTDGNLDLLVANSEDGSVSLLLGDGDGFTLGQLFRDPSLVHPSALALAHDGERVELYVTDSGEEIATIFDLNFADSDEDGSVATAINSKSNQNQTTNLLGQSSLVMALLSSLPGWHDAGVARGEDAGSADELRDSLANLFADLFGNRQGASAETLTQVFSEVIQRLSASPRETTEIITEEFVVSSASTLLDSLGINSRAPQIQSLLRDIVRPLVKLQIGRTVWLQALEQIHHGLRAVLPTSPSGESARQGQGAAVTTRRDLVVSLTVEEKPGKTSEAREEAIAGAVDTLMHQLTIETMPTTESSVAEEAPTWELPLETAPSHRETNRAVWFLPIAMIQLFHGRSAVDHERLAKRGNPRLTRRASSHRT